MCSMIDAITHARSAPWLARKHSTTSARPAEKTRTGIRLEAISWRRVIVGRRQQASSAVTHVHKCRNTRAQLEAVGVDAGAGMRATEQRFWL